MTIQEAMSLYIQESERQIRVYGATALLSPPAIEAAPESTGGPQPQPRGLAAIPLLCAAASESRAAYLRRLGNTQTHMAWWSRQEPLTATPGSLWALPEAGLIAVASLVEAISLRADFALAAVLQSWLWPLHNVLLALWMGMIINFTAWSAAWDLLQTVVWGSRRTGWSLTGIWRDEVAWTAQSVQILTEGHQPLTARLVGLSLLPLMMVVQVAGWPPSPVGKASMFIGLLLVSWWFWFLTLPWLGLCLMGCAILAGNCFALIEVAGV